MYNLLYKTVNAGVASIFSLQKEYWFDASGNKTYNETNTVDWFQRTINT